MIQPEFKLIRKLLVENTTYFIKTLEFFSRVDGLLAFSAPFRHVSTRLYQTLND